MAKPKTAYDVRRYITLVQVIAASGSDEALRNLCDLWGIDVVEDRSEPPYHDRYYMNVWATLIALAQHVIEYHQNETNPKKLIVPREKPEGSTGTIDVCG